MKKILTAFILIASASINNPIKIFTPIQKTCLWLCVGGITGSAAGVLIAHMQDDNKTKHEKVAHFLTKGLIGACIEMSMAGILHYTLLNYSPMSEPETTQLCNSCNIIQSSAAFVTHESPAICVTCFATKNDPNKNNSLNQKIKKLCVSCKQNKSEKNFIKMQHCLHEVCLNYFVYKYNSDSQICPTCPNQNPEPEKQKLCQSCKCTRDEHEICLTCATKSEVSDLNAAPCELCKAFNTEKSCCVCFETEIGKLLQPPCCKTIEICKNCITSVNTKCPGCRNENTYKYFCIPGTWY